MTNHTLNQVRRELLRRHSGLISDNIADPRLRADPRMTTAMRLAEKAVGRPLIEVLDLSRTGVEIARELKIDDSTVAKWRKRLGILFRS